MMAPCQSGFGQLVWMLHVIAAASISTNGNGESLMPMASNSEDANNGDDDDENGIKCNEIINESMLSFVLNLKSDTSYSHKSVLFMLILLKYSNITHINRSRCIQSINELVIKQ